MKLSQIDITYISIAIGYTILIFGYNKYISYYDISETDTLLLIKTLFNVFIYMGILLAWFFTKQSVHNNNPNLLITMGYAAATLFLSGLFLYVSFEGIEYIMEKGIVNDQTQLKDATTPEKNYCPDVCNWFNTKDQCTSNTTWNGITCAWNASKKMCSTPAKQEPWLRNIIRSIFVLLTLIILLLMYFSKDRITQILQSNPNLKWILEIPNIIHENIEKYKKDINVTTPTTWLLLGVELILLALYFFSHYFAYRAYNKYGFIIHNPPLGLSYKTVVGCETLNMIHQHQEQDTDDVDKQGVITIKEGALTNFLPLPENIKDNTGPIPNETYTLTTDFIIHRNKTTQKSGDPSGTNYNYGLSMWIYIDPHQPNNGYDYWYSFFSFDSKPTLLYNPKTNAIKLSMQENKTPTIAIKDSIKYSKPVKDVPLQKWNHVFINTLGSKTDLFLNGNLVSNIIQGIPRNQTDKIVTGSHNGIVGRICNIYYFKQPLNGTQILDIYHKYKNYDPPMAF